MSFYNFYSSTDSREFYLWVDPKDWLIIWNLGLNGKFSNPRSDVKVEHPHDNLAFIPNPNYKVGDVTPYQNNISKRFMVEYYLEHYRPKAYPSRVQALYLFMNEHDAHTYSRVHPDHVKGRMLIKGFTKGFYEYSQHDSSWFDYLCKQHFFDKILLDVCGPAYWQGQSVEMYTLSLPFRKDPWKQETTFEVLFHGHLHLLEEERAKIKKIGVDMGILNP